MAVAFVRGSIAGCLATVPMTLVMELLHRQLPASERYPLPPSEILTATEQLGLGEHLAPPAHMAATLVAHFGYGALTGGLYGLLARSVALPSLLTGVGFGMLVWVGSYMGVLPALGILNPATEHPARRNALMVAAHAVWGAALGLIFVRLDAAWRASGT